MENGKNLKLMKFKLKKITDDASYRQFYRLYKGNKTSIIVSSQKEKFKNLVVYYKINKFLRQKKILTPKLLKEFFKQGMIEIEDFGNISFNEYLKNKKNKYNTYKKLINLLIKIQKIKPKKTIFLNTKCKINFDFYNLKNLHKESDLFFNWYLVGILGKIKAKKYKNKIRPLLNKIYKKIYFKNTCFVHRDFHASNLMYFKKKIGVIDTQDAIIGNPAYDLASLVDDVRIKIPISQKNKIVNFYLKNKQKDFNIKKNKFIRDFNILSIQRNLKILGIFYRLFKRDNKIKYLKFMPYTWKLIELRLKSNNIFDDLAILLNQAINKTVRNKITFK